MIRWIAREDAAEAVEVVTAQTALSIEAQESINLGLYQQALKAHSASQLVDAVGLFQELLRQPLIERATTEVTEKSGDIRGKPSLYLRYLCHKNLGQLYVKQQELEKAMENYLQAIEIDSSDAAVWNEAGSLALSLHHMCTSRFALENALCLNSNNVRALRSLADALFIIGDDEACTDALNAIAERDNISSRANKLKEVMVRAAVGDRELPAGGASRKRRRSDGVEAPTQVNVSRASWVDVVGALLDAVAINTREESVKISRKAAARGTSCPLTQQIELLVRGQPLAPDPKEKAEVEEMVIDEPQPEMMAVEVTPSVPAAAVPESPVLQRKSTRVRDKPQRSEVDSKDEEVSSLDFLLSLAAEKPSDAETIAPVASIAIGGPPEVSNSVDDFFEAVRTMMNEGESIVQLAWDTCERLATLWNATWSPGLPRLFVDLFGMLFPRVHGGSPALLLCAAELAFDVFKTAQKIGRSEDALMDVSCAYLSSLLTLLEAEEDGAQRLVTADTVEIAGNPDWLAFSLRTWWLAGRIHAIRETPGNSFLAVGALNIAKQILAAMGSSSSILLAHCANDRLINAGVLNSMLTELQFNSKLKTIEILWVNQDWQGLSTLVGKSLLYEWSGFGDGSLPPWNSRVQNVSERQDDVAETQKHLMACSVLDRLSIADKLREALWQLREIDACVAAIDGILNEVKDALPAGVTIDCALLQRTLTTLVDIWTGDDTPSLNLPPAMVKRMTGALGVAVHTIVTQIGGQEITPKLWVLVDDFLELGDFSAAVRLKTLREGHKELGAAGLCMADEGVFVSRMMKVLESIDSPEVEYDLDQCYGCMYNVQFSVFDDHNVVGAVPLDVDSATALLRHFLRRPAVFKSTRADDRETLEKLAAFFVPDTFSIKLSTPVQRVLGKVSSILTKSASPTDVCKAVFAMLVQTKWRQVERLLWPKTKHEAEQFWDLALVSDMVLCLMCDIHYNGLQAETWEYLGILYGEAYNHYLWGVLSETKLDEREEYDVLSHVARNCLYCLRRGITCEPKREQSWWILGVFMYNQLDFIPSASRRPQLEDCAECFQQALAINDADPRYTYYLGKCLEILGGSPGRTLELYARTLNLLADNKDKKLYEPLCRMHAYLLRLLQSDEHLDLVAQYRFDPSDIEHRHPHGDSALRETKELGVVRPYVVNPRRSCALLTQAFSMNDSLLVFTEAFENWQSTQMPAVMVPDLSEARPRRPAKEPELADEKIDEPAPTVVAELAAPAEPRQPATDATPMDMAPADPAAPEAIPEVNDPVFDPDGPITVSEAVEPGSDPAVGLNTGRAPVVENQASKLAGGPTELYRAALIENELAALRYIKNKFRYSYKASIRLAQSLLLLDADHLPEAWEIMMTLMSRGKLSSNMFSAIWFEQRTSWAQSFMTPWPRYYVYVRRCALLYGSTLAAAGKLDLLRDFYMKMVELPGLAAVAPDMCLLLLQAHLDVFTKRVDNSVTEADQWLKVAFDLFRQHFALDAGQFVPVVRGTAWNRIIVVALTLLVNAYVAVKALQLDPVADDKPVREIGIAAWEHCISVHMTESQTTSSQREQVG